MIFKQIGMVLVFLIILASAGNIWFYFVDGIIEKIKCIFYQGNQKENWHTLPEDDSNKKE